MLIFTFSEMVVQLWNVNSSVNIARKIKCFISKSTLILCQYNAFYFSEIAVIGFTLDEIKHGIVFWGTPGIYKGSIRRRDILYGTEERKEVCAYLRMQQKILPGHGCAFQFQFHDLLERRRNRVSRVLQCLFSRHFSCSICKSWVHLHSSYQHVPRSE